MKEEFLHFVWQFLYFNTLDLETTTGEKVDIVRQGNLQPNSGPDLENCHVRIGNLSFRGNIEIHVKSSDWNRHRHQHDQAYNNVILHVVWEEDIRVKNSQGQYIPTLELKGRTNISLYQRYRQLLTNRDAVMCGSRLGGLEKIRRLQMIDRALTGRLETKAKEVLSILESHTGDWQTTLYQVLCRSFGFKVNNSPFLHLAEVLPFRILRRHTGNLQQVEALLFGSAGFLEDTTDEYSTALKKEYSYLAAKYNLLPRKMSRMQWKFMRMRPANFPTVRLAQLAGVICQAERLFTGILYNPLGSTLTDCLNHPASAYWNTHYDFGKCREKKLTCSLGRKSVESILINAVVPVLAAYAKHTGNTLYTEQAITLLEKLTPEDNSIIRRWQQHGMIADSAYDTQGLLALYNNYCTRKKCLNCSIGLAVLKEQPAGKKPAGETVAKDKASGYIVVSG